MTKLTDKQFKQLQKKLFEYVDGMNTDQLKYDLKRYMLEDYLNQPTWKLVSDKLIEFIWQTSFSSFSSSSFP